MVQDRRVLYRACHLQRGREIDHKKSWMGVLRHKDIQIPSRKKLFGILFIDRACNRRAWLKNHVHTYVIS